LTPDRGFPGDTIILVGKNFSDDLLQNVVMFNQTIVPEAYMIRSNINQITVRVPDNCGTGPVSVSTGDKLDSGPGPVFTYEYGRITSLVPAQGKKGDTVFIKGESFSTVKNIVKFNGVPANVFYESDTLIKAVVPVNCGTGTVSITLPNALIIKSTFDFIYTYTYTSSTYIGVAKTAGDQNGPFLTATFKDMHAFVYDYRSRSIYISDGNCIRRCNNGQVTTWAGVQGTAGYKDGYGVAALLDNPGKLAVSNIGDLYIPDLNNFCIRKITAANALVTTYCGKAKQAGDLDGKGNAAMFGLPYSVDILNDSIYFISDAGNKKIRRVDTKAIVKTVPLSTPSASMQVFVLDKNTLLGLDVTNNQLMKIDLVTNVISVFAGAGTVGSADGDMLMATFNTPTSIAMRVVNGKREIYIADTDNNVIRKITSDNKVSTVMGDAAGYTDGVNRAILFDHPNGLAFDEVNYNILYVLDNGNKVIRKVMID
jgi:large repetitive protein